MPVNVAENIERITASKVKIQGDITSLEEQIKFAKEELLRMDGCLICFNGFQEAGIVNIVDENQHSVDKNQPYLDQVNDNQTQCNQVNDNQTQCNQVNDNQAQCIQVKDVHSHHHEANDTLGALYSKYRTM
jgi:hypothetical protein